MKLAANAHVEVQTNSNMEHTTNSSPRAIKQEAAAGFWFRLQLLPPSSGTEAASAGELLKRNLTENLVSLSLSNNPNMARGLKKHLKRLNAPKHWMLDKLGGAFAPKPSSGPHKSRECLPLILIIRNRLKYALTYREVIAILMQRHVLVDGKVRTDKTYPAGFMDVVSIPKTNENFRLLYDTKGRFRLHSIRDEEAKYKLCKVRSVQFGKKGIPYLNTYDGRTIRYPDPLIKANDTIKLDLETNKVTDFIKFDVGNVVMVTGGRNRGRVGVIKNREKHKGSFETIHVTDAQGHEFATRLGNVFIIGKGPKPWVSLPKGKGIKLSVIEEAKKRQAAAQASATA
ncbi:40S ribosomal protein S4 [Dionaea muscipula]